MSLPAKAGDPVITAVCVHSAPPEITGCPAFAGHDIVGLMMESSMSDHPEAILAGKNRPFTGAEYLASLRDGREVYIYGERVKDVTAHPAFRNAAASIALLYDALHDEKAKAVLTAPTDAGSAG